MRETDSSLFMPNPIQLQPIKTIPMKFNGCDIEVLNGIIGNNTARAEIALEES